MRLGMMRRGLLVWALGMLALARRYGALAALTASEKPKRRQGPTPAARRSTRGHVLILVAVAVLSLAQGAAAVAQTASPVATPRAGTPVATPQAATPIAAAPALPYPELMINATDAGFSLPAQVTAGRYLVTLANTGSLPIEGAIIRLPTGATAAAYQSALATPTATLPSWLSQTVSVGGPGGAPPGGWSRSIVDLTPGSYIITTNNNRPALTQGFEVVAGSGATAGAAQAPPTDGQVSLVDFAFGLPGRIAAGYHVWQVTNTGSQVHQFILYGIPPGFTSSQVLDAITSPVSATPRAGGLTAQDFVPVGGLAELSPRQTAWTVLDLAPGHYVAMCFVQDPATKEPHVLEGMIATFDATGPAALPLGARVVTTDSGVNLRATPSLTGQVVATLGQGQALVVTGAPVPTGSLLWYPAQEADNPQVTGYVAADFLKLGP